LHLGHLIIAQDAAEHLGLSEVVFIPAAVPPHKQDVQQVAAEHRLNMLRLAVQEDDRFSVSDIEIQRGGLSYSADTVEALAATYHNTDLFFIVGSDTLVELHTWRRIEELLQMCTVATIMRPGTDSLECISEKIRVPEKYREVLMENVIASHRIGISSSEIRRRNAAGKSIGYLVPPAVEAYIYEHGLYK